MVTVSLTEARNKLSKLLDKVERGQDVMITRRRRPVALLSRYRLEAHPNADVHPKKPIRSLAAFRAKMPRLDPPLSETLRRMRDEQR